MFGTRKGLTGIALALALPACTMETQEMGEGEVASETQEIISGSVLNTNTYNVALYHFSIAGTCTAVTESKYYPNNDTIADDPVSPQMWWPRPCSGTLIRRDAASDTNYILTARHCVTTNGEITGTPITASSWLRATAATQPGVLTTLEEPEADPPSLKTTQSPPTSTLKSTVHYENYGTYEDLAIVKTVGNLGFTSSPTRLGIIGFTSGLPGQSLLEANFVLRGSGYGRSVPGNCWNHDDSGAGVLRNASGFDVTSAFYKTFDHSLGSNGAAIVGGDSGGSLWVLNVAQNWTSTRLVGVNSTSWTAAGGESLLDFVQAGLGHVYLTQLENTSGTTVVGSNNTLNAAVTLGYSTDTAGTHVTYQRSNRTLHMGSFCIVEVGSNQPIKLASCNGLSPPRAWDITPAGVITNKDSGRCLHYDTGSTTLKTVTCPASPRKWTFVADIDPAQ